MKSPFISPEEKLKRKRSLSYTERFDLMMKMIRINNMLRSAKIIKKQNGPAG